MADVQTGERRSALRYVGGFLLTALGVAFAIPALIFYSDPLRRRRPVAGGDGDVSAPGGASGDTTAGESAHVVAVAQLGELPDLDRGDAPLRAAVVAKGLRDAWNRLDQVKLGSVYLGKRGGALSCLSATCPHAGCGIDYDEGRRQFVCPCHNSTFSVDGQRLTGPAPRDMDRLDLAVQGSTVFCRYSRFRLALKNKVPV